MTISTTDTSVLSRRDIAFLLHEWLRVEGLVERPRFEQHDRKAYDDVIDLAERIAIDRFAPHYRTSDAQEPFLGADGKVVLPAEVGAALETVAEAGLFGAAMDERVGGMQLPQVVTSAAYAFLQAANVATMSYATLTVAGAHMLLAHASEEQIDTWARPMAEGRYFGTMCLSETQAGSSLADIRTRAELQADGTYRLSGSKMWTSGGEHELAENIVHLVLAKAPGGGPGVRGISLFIVPRFLLDDAGDPTVRNDVVLAGVNHKMGWRGTVNAVLGFGEGVHTPGGRPGAVGYLVGQEHRGLAYMFRMMNEARVSVGLGAVCLGYAGYLKALRYATEREQGRPLGAKSPGRAPVPIIRHPDVKRMLLAQKSYVEGGLALSLYCSRLLDEQATAPDEASRTDAGLLLDVLTPIAKSWPAQWCLEANSLAIQVHGGYGYAREYEVEQHYRDYRLNAIHEGTHGIQALDLLGRKMAMHDGAGFVVLRSAIRASMGQSSVAGGGRAEMAAALADAVSRLERVTRLLVGQYDPEIGFANATVYLEACGHIVVAWIWLQLIDAAAGKEGAIYDGKRRAARYFYRYELPKVGPQLDLLERLDLTAVEMKEEWF